MRAAALRAGSLGGYDGAGKRELQLGAAGGSNGGRHRAALRRRAQAFGKLTDARFGLGQALLAATDHAVR